MPEQRMENYRPIHKAIRYLLYSTALQVGMADFGDSGVASEALDKLDRTISMLKEHAERFIHPPLERRVPGIAESFDQDHDDDERLYAQLEQLAAQIRDSKGDQPTALGNQVYTLFNGFIGSYLGHMAREETELEKAILDNFTDEELVAMEQEIMSSVPPQRMGEWLGVICSSLYVDELTGMLGGMKVTAPPQAVEGMLTLSQQAMPADTWKKVWAKIS